MLDIIAIFVFVFMTSLPVLLLRRLKRRRTTDMTWADSKQFRRMIQNMVGNVTGMVCDGAKADCALKISTCVNAACQAAAMGTRGVRVQSTDGIVEENVERTLDNFAILSTHGTSDSVILDLMLNKEHAPDAE